MLNLAVTFQILTFLLLLIDMQIMKPLTKHLNNLNDDTRINSYFSDNCNLPDALQIYFSFPDIWMEAEMYKHLQVALALP